ncbi:MAG: ferritin [Pseudomonadota bacterium]
MSVGISGAVADAFNRQINSELKASYAYRAMAAYFDDQQLPGFAKWFIQHAEEEVSHSMRLYDHLVQRGARVTLEAMEQPESEFADPEAAVLAALSMEGEVTAQINELFDLVQESKDFGSQPVLHWFLDEQVSEEDTFSRLLDQVKSAGDSRWHLLALDQQLGGAGASVDEG